VHQSDEESFYLIHRHFIIPLIIERRRARSPRLYTDLLSLDVAGEWAANAHSSHPIKQKAGVKLLYFEL
jgi:hypothetical protein